MRRDLRPREGRLAFLLLTAMLLSLAAALQASGWLSRAGFAIPVALAAGLVGAGLALSRRRWFVTMPLGAVLGAGVVISAVAVEYLPGPAPLDRLLALGGQLQGWLATVLAGGHPGEEAPYALCAAALLWATAFMAAYALYRHHRPLQSVGLVGIGLVVVLSTSRADLLGYLVAFTIASLLLWLRVAITARQDRWRSRGVERSPAVPGAMLRTGAIFTAVVIGLSWSMALVAVGAPLGSAWQRFESFASEISGGLPQLIRVSGGPGLGTSFGTQITISRQWSTDDTPMFEATGSSSAYFATVAYDTYTGDGWKVSNPVAVQVQASTPFFNAGSPEIPTSGFRQEEVSIDLLAGTHDLFSPGVPIGFSVPAVLSEPDGVRYLGGLQSRDALAAAASYTVVADVPAATPAQLAAAPTTYPDEISRLYVGASAFSPHTRELAKSLVAHVASDSYDQAMALAAYLAGSDSSFTYATSASLPSDPHQDVVDYFLFNSKTGYCEFFASAMVAMARSVGIPARFVMGFHGGTVLANGTVKFTHADAHAWAELYFPGYGWVPFEATKGEPAVGQPSSGEPSATPPPVRPRLPSLGPRASVSPAPASVSGPGPGGGGPSPFGLIAVMTATVVTLFGLLALWWRRDAEHRLRGAHNGERSWSQLVLAARRAGIGPRASETVFEYAGWLEEQIPEHRAEIQVLAVGTVTRTYSGRPETDSAGEPMDVAWRRLRRPLAWLAVRGYLRRLVHRE